ncbi:hypothetical protein Q3W71_15555 [Micromonospora sp. C28SCA-DRY-2]|uniref:hypothetical protein n=1 Tax=Micromonospora sp. C28SCA-DRY-2 TaxID=3059522 RepID=UPI002674A9BA|nr:hypothetical protein [Micromonospora sp. C28SCA-DRY-2]MDO3703086.1 hypothetical protein [Micromonospora sp. C28SCA-DRY-2]
MTRAGAPDDPAATPAPRQEVHADGAAFRATADVARASVAAAWWRTGALVHTVLRPGLVNDRWRG